MLRVWLAALGLLILVASATNAATSLATRVDGTTVCIETNDDLKLIGTFRKPRARKGALAPAALLIHDGGSDRASLDAVAERLWKQGFAVLNVDLRGHGESTSDKQNWSKAKPEERDGLWAFATRDIDAAAAWLLGQENVHRTNLNLVAHGSGAALAARHALDDENVRSIALLEPPTACHGFDLAADLLDLGGLPTLILAPKGKDSPTARMVQEANAGAEPHPYVTLMSLKKEIKVLDDKKTPSKVAVWLREQASPGGK